jgi:tetratricopeptide (TPR) repeat protein
LALYGSVPKESALTTAQDALNKAFEIDSNLGSAHASQGLLFSTQNRNNEAEASFERAIELSPSYAMAYMWYGSLLQERGEIEKAQRLFIKAFEIDPKSPVAAFNVAWGHYMLGAETEAMDWFSKIVANDPYYPGAYILVGNILRNRGHLDEAIDMYQRVLDIDALNKNAIISLLTTTMDIQAFEQTQLWFTYLDDNPSILSNFERQMIRIRFMATQGKLEEAVKIFEQIEFTPSEEIQRLIITAEIAFYQQDYAAAAETYERLRENFKDNKSAFFFLSEGITAAHLAYCYEQSGQQRKADTLLVDYDRYLQNDRNKKANNPSYYYNMSLLYALRDADEEAFNYLQGAIDAGWVQVWEAKIEPIFSNLASKPRFNQMMGGVNARLAYMRNRLENPRAEVVADG